MFFLAFTLFAVTAASIILLLKRTTQEEPKPKTSWGKYKIAPKEAKFTGAAVLVYRYNSDNQLEICWLKENRIPKGDHDDFRGFNQPPRWPKSEVMVNVSGVTTLVPQVLDDYGNDITIQSVDTAFEWYEKQHMKKPDKIPEREKSLVIQDFIKNTDKFEGREYELGMAREAAKDGEKSIDCADRALREEFGFVTDLDCLFYVGRCGRPSRDGEITRATDIYVCNSIYTSNVKKDLHSNFNSPKSMGFDRIGVSVDFYEVQDKKFMKANDLVKKLANYKEQNKGSDLSRWGALDMLLLTLHLMKTKEVITDSEYAEAIIIKN